MLVAVPSFAQAPAPSPSAASPQPAFQVKVQGQGRPIVMIPGLASSGATYDATAAHLAPHFRCIQVAITPEADGYTISLRGGPDVVVSRRQAKLLRDLLTL